MESVNEKERSSEATNPSTDEECNPKLEDIDQGWAWVVLMASIVIQTVILGLNLSVGVFYVEVLEAFDESHFLTSLFGSLSLCLIFFLGPLASVLAHRFGFRLVIGFSGVLLAIGYILSAFAPNLAMLTLSYGVVAGSGFGICLTPAYTVLETYFDKYLNAALALSSVGGAIGSMTLVLLSQYLIDEYSWRGALLLSGGIALHVIICACLMRPSRSYVANHRRLKDLFRRNLLLDLRFVLTLIGAIFDSCSIYSIFVILPNHINDCGFTPDDGAIIMTILGVGNTIGRLATGLSGLIWKQLPVFFIFTLSSLVFTVILLLYLASHQFIYLAILSFSYGIWFGAHESTLPGTLATLFSPPDLPATFGLLLFTSGIGNLIGPPILGSLYDMSGSYDSSFVCIGTFSLIGFFLLVPVYIIQRRKHKEMTVSSVPVLF